MFKKYLKIILLVWLVIIMSPQLALAANPALDKLQEVGTTRGPYNNMSDEYGLSIAVGTVVSAALALVGSIFLILMLYAGYHWMTAQGEEEKVAKAKDTINRAIIGIIIVVGAYAIWAFVFSKLF